MTVWSSSVVVAEFNVENTDADAGPFSAITSQGVLPIAPQPELGIPCDQTTTGGGPGSTVYGQGGGVSVS